LRLVWYNVAERLRQLLAAAQERLRAAALCLCFCLSLTQLNLRDSHRAAVDPHLLHLPSQVALMADDSKNSNKVLKGVTGLLVVWFIISIIIIVVWATSPDLKGSAQCRAELQDMATKLEGAKVQFSENKMALEEQVLEAREDQDRLKGKILLLVGHLNTTNTMLEECRQKNVSAGFTSTV
ncbi:hypothetical protein XENOCAPTIV_005517, partial [Xenoophorus captivus]